MIFFQFFCCMLIVLTAEIAAGVWAYQNGSKLEAFVKLNFKNTVENEYGKMETRTEMIDAIQIKLQCCGVDGPKDYSNSKLNNAKGPGLLDLAISTAKLSYSVPPSCCKNDTDKATCETSRKGAITTSINPYINKVVSHEGKFNLNLAERSRKFFFSGVHGKSRQRGEGEHRIRDDWRSHPHFRTIIRHTARSVPMLRSQEK